MQAAVALLSQMCKTKCKSILSALSERFKLANDRGLGSLVCYRTLAVAFFGKPLKGAWGERRRTERLSDYYLVSLSSRPHRLPRMGRNKKGMFESEFDALRPAKKQGNDPWKRQRKERINHSPSNLPKVDVHGILFAVVDSSRSSSSCTP